MRNIFLLSCVAAIGLGVAGPMRAASVCNSVAGNLVTNCGFETNSFSGWTLSGNLQGGVPNGPTNNYIYIDSGNPNSGLYDAYMGAQTTYGQSRSGSDNGPLTIMKQTLSPLLPREYYDVSFYVWNSGCGSSCAGLPGDYEYFDAFFNGNLLTAQTNQAGSSSPDYVLYNFVIGTGPSGNNGLLQFNFVNDDAAFQLDDVSVTAIGPVPEPATYALIMPALAGLLYLSRRRRTA